MRIFYHKKNDSESENLPRPGSLWPPILIVLATAVVATGLSIITGNTLPVVFWTLLTGLFWSDRMLRNRQ